MYHILLAIHVITCLFLIVSILLQAGRGGGLTEAFGGQTQSVLGSQAPNILKKATEISAILFLVLSLVLAMFAARRGKSLFQQMRVPVRMPVAASVTNEVPAAPAASVPSPGESTAEAE
ncbi:MAG: preprotein translocase subunit SecG [Candidatus Omnitrophica bacterium]|nr:preprotein translocase subunit SecG [Candidatus Omnitrophota bacterium]MBU1128547.1 preprotein translocase subunit SecG [Candidatus Omnitrophota bacterium]MBU1783747.1 preprotein translocase subunit SecG [Candidatus Omnitrophota bacterium]MBU1851744.1 preprotein translocase subunit SecG [Candidatus Omnitrophota bacterium]